MRCEYCRRTLETLCFIFGEEREVAGKKKTTLITCLTDEAKAQKLKAVCFPRTDECDGRLKTVGSDGTEAEEKKIDVDEKH